MSVYIPAATRALDVWRAILGEPHDIAFKTPRIVRKDGTVTPEVTLNAQTVRISRNTRTVQVVGAAGETPTQEVMIFGVRDHPTVDSTDMQEGYTARIDGDTYRIAEITFYPGEIRARAEVIG